MSGSNGLRTLELSDDPGVPDAVAVVFADPDGLAEVVPDEVAVGFPDPIVLVCLAVGIFDFFSVENMCLGRQENFPLSQGCRRI